MSFSLEGTGTDQTNPTFGTLQNWFWRAHSMVRFPPEIVRYVLPPHQLPNFWGGRGVHAWNGYHLSFWRFFPCFIVFFASKLAIFPLKRSVLGAWKGHIRARKERTNGDFGVPKPQNHLKCLKTMENVTTPQLASLHGLVSNWAKNCYEIGEETLKGQMVPISRAHGGGVGFGRLRTAVERD